MTIKAQTPIESELPGPSPSAFQRATVAIREAEALLGKAMTLLEIASQHVEPGDDGLARRLASKVEHTRNAVTELRERYELGR